jgi:hypothetical protein
VRVSAVLCGSVALVGARGLSRWNPSCACCLCRVRASRPPAGALGPIHFLGICVSARRWPWSPLERGRARTGAGAVPGRRSTLPSYE